MINYLCASTTFGSMYKTYILWDAQVETSTCLDTKKRMRPLFIGEKMTAFVGGMLYSPILAPWWLTMCLDRIEIKCRGKCPEDFGYETQRKSLLDYIFT